MSKSSRKQTQDYQDRVIKELEAAPDKKIIFGAFEDDMIRKYYPSKGASAVAKALNLKPEQIRHRAGTLGVKRR